MKPLFLKPLFLKPLFLKPLLLKLLLLPVMAVFLAGCASQNATWDYNPDYSLTGLKTYAWLDNKEVREKNGYEANSLTDERVHSAANDILKTKGLHLSEQVDGVDVLINYVISVKTRREDQQVTTSLGFGRNSWGVGFSNDHYVNEYEEGRLIIDFIDPETKKVLWRGVSKSRLQENLTPQDRTAKINTAVSHVLAGFPHPTEK